MTRRTIPTVLGQSLTFPPYGDDTGLIFRHPLTTLADADELETALGFTGIAFSDVSTLTAKRNVVDPALGLSSQSSDGTNVCIRLNTPTGTDWAVTDGDSGVLVQFDVTTEWLASGDIIESSGYMPVVNEVIASFGPSSVGDSSFWKLTDGTNRMDAVSANVASFSFMDFIYDSSVLTVNFKMQSQGKRGYTTVGFGFFNHHGTNLAFITFDGQLIKGGVYDGATSNILTYLSLFGQMHQGTNTPYQPFQSSTPYYIKNLQISSLPADATIPVNYVLGNVVGFGDSITNSNGYTFNSGSTMDAGWPSLAARALIDNGMRWRTYRQAAQGGYGLKASGSDIVSKIGTGTGELFDAAEASPDTVVLFLGTNDTVDFVSSADYKTEYLDCLDRIFGVESGGTRTTVNNVALIVPPPRADGADQDNLTAIRDVVKAMPGYWNTHYPALAGRVYIGADYEDILGSDTANYSSTWSSDDVHPNVAANAQMGPVLGAKLYAYASQIRRNLIT